MLLLFKKNKNKTKLSYIEQTNPVSGTVYVEI